MKTSERKKGISLIVLIITILVMIILAAAIILNIDDTKIINRADKAVADNNMAVAEEIRVVAKAEWRVNEEKLRNEGYNSFKRYLEYKLGEAGITGVFVTSKGELTEIYIPEGFVKSKATGESTLEEGIVIYEGEVSVTDKNVDEARTTRNQYVWIPVPDINQFERIDWGYGDLKDAATSYNLEDTNEEAEYLAMKASVEKYGGFFIARYEAGKEGTALVSKKEATIWNKVAGSQMFADTMKKTIASLSSGDSVAHLIYGEEWDAALNFIAKTDVAYPISSVGKGWYKSNYSANSTHITGLDIPGENASNKVKNIYDMSGNIWEWTMEKEEGGNRRVLRGGWYYANDKNNEQPAGHRYIAAINSAQGSYGFRVALYIK